MKKLGFEEGVARALLKAMRRENVIDIRGYSKQPEHLRRGTETLMRKRGACGKAASNVETDNK
jgi:hypothetical protein